MSRRITCDSQKQAKAISEMLSSRCNVTCAACLIPTPSVSAGITLHKCNVIIKIMLLSKYSKYQNTSKYRKILEKSLLKNAKQLHLVNKYWMVSLGSPLESAEQAEVLGKQGTLPVCRKLYPERLKENKSFTLTSWNVRVSPKIISPCHPLWVSKMNHSISQSVSRKLKWIKNRVLKLRGLLVLVVVLWLVVCFGFACFLFQIFAVGEVFCSWKYVVWSGKVSETKGSISKP